MAAHSEEYINDSRYDWWSSDFLRLRLADEISPGCSILDVGVGGGHWSALLATALSIPLRVIGLDFEKKWLEQAAHLFERDCPLVRFESVEGMANSIPIPEANMDVVTCQTVLMHLPDPVGALFEMHRVLKTGGSVIIAEPANQINRACAYLSLVSDDVEASAALWAVWAGYHSGRRKAEQGNANIGLVLYDLLGKIGFTNIRVCQNDKVWLFGSADEAYAEAEAELADQEAQELMRIGGVGDDMIRGARAGLERMRLSSATVPTVSHGVPQYLYIASK